MAKYTFSVIGTDGIKYFPKKRQIDNPNFVPGTGLLDFEWGTDMSTAIKWDDPDVVSTIAIEFCDSEVVEVPELIKVTYVSDQKKFVSFDVDGLKDGIIVGLIHPDLPIDDPKQGLSIAYRGEVVPVPFNSKLATDMV